MKTGTTGAFPSGHFSAHRATTEGISELDYFAAHAISGQAFAGDANDIASAAYDIAEAMVAERHKRKALRDANIK